VILKDKKDGSMKINGYSGIEERNPEGIPRKIKSNKD